MAYDFHIIDPTIAGIIHAITTTRPEFVSRSTHSMVDVRLATRDMDGLAICGNINPLAIFLQGTPEQVRVAVLDNASAGYPLWMSAGGCEVPDKTPTQNLHAQSQALKELILA